MAAKTTSQKGQNFIEFAMCLAVLPILLLGVIEVSRALYMANITNRLSREGASMASRNGRVTDVALNKVKDALLASATPPLDMAAHGAIILSVLTVTSGTRATLTEQVKYVGTGGSLRTRLSNHPRGDTDVRLAELAGILNGESLGVGEQIVVAEILYEYLPLTPIGEWGLNFNAGQPLKLYSVSTFFLTVVVPVSG